MAQLDFCRSAAIAHVHQRIEAGVIPAGEIVAVGDVSVTGRVPEAVATAEALIADFKREHAGTEASSPTQPVAAQEGSWSHRFGRFAQAVDRYLPDTEVKERIVVRVRHATGEATYPVDVTDPFATSAARQAAQTTLFAGAAPFVGPGVIFAGAAMCWKRSREDADANTRIAMKRTATKLGALSVLRMLPVTEPMCLILGGTELAAKRALQQRASYTSDGA